jgi:hypothetical protein
MQIIGDTMSIIAGKSGEFVGVVTASDNSTVTAVNFVWSASDPAVTITPNSSDATGATVDVTVPASDTATSFTLSVTADATTPTSLSPTKVSGSLVVTIQPAPVPVTFTVTINQTK